MLPSRSLHSVRFQAQLLFCLPAILGVCVSRRRRAGEDGAWKMSTLLYGQALLSGSWTEPGVLRLPVQAALPLQAFLYMLLPP